MKPVTTLYELVHSYKYVFLAEQTLTVNLLRSMEPTYELECPELMELTDNGDALFLCGLVYAFPDWNMAVITTTTSLYPLGVNALIREGVKWIDEEQVDYMDDLAMELKENITEGLENSEGLTLFKLLLKGFLTQFTDDLKERIEYANYYV